MVVGRGTHSHVLQCWVAVTPLSLCAKGAHFTGERYTPTWMLAESAKDYVVLALGKLFSDCFVSGRQAKEVSPGV
jgi:hypothetical protein